MAWLEAWIAAERGRFVLWLPVWMGAGVLTYFALRAEPAGWVGAAVLLLSVCSLAAVWRWWATRAVLLACAAFAIGFASAQWATFRAPPLPALPRTAVVLTGTVRGIDLLPVGRRITIADVRLSPDAAPLPRLVRVRLKNDDPVELGNGDRIRLRALVRPPSPPAWPGGWDLQRDAFFSGMAGYGFALGRAELLARAAPTGIAAWWRGVRDAIGARIMAAVPGPTGAIATTLLTGTTTAIPEADRAAFRDSGLAHLLAVAGLHIGLVMALIFGLARWLLAQSEYAALHWPAKQIAAVAALAVGLFYLLLTGAHVPIQRSFAMAALVTIGLLVGRRAVSLRGLAIAATVLILISPQEVAGVSFQMSFSAVLALIAGYEALRPWMQRLRGEGGWCGRTAVHLAALALTSLLAGTASAPFAAWHFGHVQLYFVLANMVAVPIAGAWVMPAGLAALALMPLGLERLALVPMGWGIAAILWVGRFFSALPAATLPVPHAPAWGLALVAFGMAWIGLWRSRMRLAGLLPLMLGLSSPAFSPPPDMLVSADARLIGLRTPNGMFLQKQSGASAFTLDLWHTLWPGSASTPFPRSGDAGQGAIACMESSCLLRPRPDGPAALLVRDDVPQLPCDQAAIVISAEPAGHACPGLPRVDRFSVWKNGAYAVWLEPGALRVISDREFRGDRPWVPPLPKPRPRKVPDLPMAKPEILPPVSQ